MDGGILMAREMVLPFRINSAGEVDSTTSMDIRIKQYIACVLLTNHNERIMRPGYGSDLVDNVFDNPAVISKQIETEIRSALAVWVPDITVKSVTIEDDTNLSGSMIIHMKYLLKDRTEQSVTLTRANIVSTDKSRFS